VLAGVLAAPLPQATHAQRRQDRATASAAVAPSRKAAEQITAAQLKDYLYFVASDEMEGRDTPSRGLDTTAKFIALNLSRWGVKPAGDSGTYFQRIILRRYKLNPAQTSIEIGGQTYRLGEDFLAQLDTRRGAELLAKEVGGPLVYVGYGWVVKSKNMDSYQGVDVKDKIMIVSGTGFPKGVTRADVRGKRGEDWSDPVTYGQTHGAKGIIYIPDFQSLASWNRLLQITTERGTIVVEKFQQPSDEPRLPAITASPGMLRARKNITSRFHRQAHPPSAG